jgi:hypothetical protein
MIVRTNCSAFTTLYYRAKLLIALSGIVVTDATLTPIKPMKQPWRVVTIFFDAIGPTVYGDEAEANPAPNFAAVSFLCLNAAIALLLIVLGQRAGRHLHPALASVYFWGGLILLVFPFTSRIARPNVARGERLFLLLLLGEAFYLYVRLYSPTAFSAYDEFLHWVTAHDILHRHRLFLENSILLVSPFYPALEIVTVGLANLAGVDVFPAAWIVLMLLRAMFVTGLFLFIERITGSTRIGALACLIYMAATTFEFHAIFSYESMGVVLVVFIMWWETKLGGSIDIRFLVPALAVLAVLAVTHHASAMFCVMYLVGVIGIEAVRRGFATAKFLMLAGTTATTFVLVFSWEWLPHNPARDYLSGAFMQQFNALIMMLVGKAEAHVPFVSLGGQTQPMWVRLTGAASVILISICLATGFVRSLTWMSPYAGWQRLVSLFRREWGDSRIVLLTLVAFGYPISILFRFSGGWEIGDRMSTWVFISVGLVVAVAIVHYWESLHWWRRSHTTLVAGIIVLGGVMIASGPFRIHGIYQVNADEASIEPMGIEAANWAKQWLGPGNNFAADRVNQLLLATYGDQNIVTFNRTSQSGGVDVKYPFVDRTIDRYALQTIKRGRIKYLEIDLRNTTDAPVLASLFGEVFTGRPRPIRVVTLLKYDQRPDVGREFDNGAIIIYNIRGLQVDDQQQ